ncbi:hypothetical protein PybrP1_002272 [[Pythium] brassicae (nom. inval.)]|nr:hypothetical protein PybrP1_002272 [[Pythium] brassicae (nom. inval.)]
MSNTTELVESICVAVGTVMDVETMGKLF